MRRVFFKITLLTLLLIAAFSSAAYGTSASIVSPSTSGIINSDSVLMSVKLSAAKTVSITMYEEKTISNVTLEDGSIIEVYNKVAVKDYTSEDMIKIAAGKLLNDDGTAVTLSNGDYVQKYKDVLYIEPVEYTNTAEMGFYTNQITSVSPGLYKLKVEVLDGEEAVSETVTSIFAVKEKPQETTKLSIFNMQPTGAMKFLQNIIKNVFN